MALLFCSYKRIDQFYVDLASACLVKLYIALLVQAAMSNKIHQEQELQCDACALRQWL